MERIENKVAKAIPSLKEGLKMLREVDTFPGELQEFLKLLKEVESEIVGILEEGHLTDGDVLMLFDHKDIAIERIRSNVGGYVCLTYKGGQIPFRPEELGRDFYVHGDFHCPASYITLIEALELAEILPEYIAFFVQKIDELKWKIKEAKKSLER